MSVISLRRLLDHDVHEEPFIQVVFHLFFRKSFVDILTEELFPDLARARLCHFTIGAYGSIPSIRGSSTEAKKIDILVDLGWQSGHLWRLSNALCILCLHHVLEQIELGFRVCLWLLLLSPLLY